MSATMDQVSQIMAYEQGELGASKTLELFSELVKSGIVWSLQGHYGRTAADLIDAGWIEKGTGKVLKVFDGEED